MPMSYYCVCSELRDGIEMETVGVDEKTATSKPDSVGNFITYNTN